MSDSKSLRAIDPEQFLRAWTKAQEIAGQMGALASLGREPTGPEDQVSSLAKDPRVQWIQAVRDEFPDQQDAAECALRFIAILTLIQAGHLGPFYHPEYGVWSEAIEMLAIAPCDAVAGYDASAVQDLLAKLTPPTV